MKTENWGYIVATKQLIQHAYVLQFLNCQSVQISIDENKNPWALIKVPDIWAEDA